MNQLQIFKSEDFGEIRASVVNDEPMFCLSDVCKILELTQPSKVRERLNQKGVNNIPTLTNGGVQNLIYVNESNLYKVIFQSRKPEAEKFTDWVTDEVLPSIRKHGAYMTDNTIEEAIANPDFLIRLATELKNEKAARRELEEKADKDRPKVLFADAVSTSHTSILIGDLAKLLKQNGYNTGQNRLFEELRKRGYLIKAGSSRNMPTQTAMERGLFDVKESTVVNPDGSVRVTKTTKVTGKGQQYFINLFLAKEN